jgi:hypothetical protein
MAGREGIMIASAVEASHISGIPTNVTVSVALRP